MVLSKIKLVHFRDQEVWPALREVKEVGEDSHCPSNFSSQGCDIAWNAVNSSCDSERRCRTS